MWENSKPEKNITQPFPTTHNTMTNYLAQITYNIWRPHTKITIINIKLIENITRFTILGRKSSNAISPADLPKSLSITEHKYPNCKGPNEALIRKGKIPIEKHKASLPESSYPNT